MLIQAQGILLWKTKIKCWGLEEHKTRGRLDSNGERKWWRDPEKAPNLQNEAPSIKNPPLTVRALCQRGEKRQEDREESRGGGILVGQVALGKTMPIMLFFDLWGAAFKDSVSKQAILWHRAPLSFLLFFESAPLSLSTGVSRAVVRAEGWGRGQGREGADWGGEGGGRVEGAFGRLSGALHHPSQPRVREAFWRALKWNVC